VTNAVPQRHLFHQKVLSAEQALELGATAITIYLFLGYDDNVEAAGIASCAQFAQECRRVGLPCIMEPLAVGGHVTGANVVDILTLGARICVELGADALKIPYTGDVDSFTRLVQVSQVPVLVLGGARSDNERDALELFAEGLEAGCHGCLMGRNVTKSPNPEQLTRQLGMVAHQGYSVDEALRGQKWDHLRLKAAPARCTGCNLCVTACVAAHGKLTFGTHLPRLHIDPVALGQHKVMFCTLCKKCIDICPTNALRWHADTAAVELLPEACTACEKCVDVCPTRVVMKGPAPAGSSLPWVPVICDLCGADPLQGPQNRDPLRSGGFPQNRDAKRNAKRDAKGYPACVKICPTAAIYSDERIKVS
jgi:ferredoxin